MSNVTLGANDVTRRYVHIERWHLARYREREVSTANLTRVADVSGRDRCWVSCVSVRVWEGEKEERRDYFSWTLAVGSRSMAALKHITSLTRALATMTSASRSCIQHATRKTYFTYVNEPSMPIPDKEPCWLKTADEAIEQAELDSSNRWHDNIRCSFRSVSSSPRRNEKKERKSVGR